MSSVTRFLRQISTPDQFVAPGNLTTLAGAAYEFVPTTANYVGNYPPGAMVAASSGTTSDIAGQIANALATAPAGAVAVLRDMGKTVYASVAATEAAAQALTVNGNYGSFRQYQLLTVSPLVNNNSIGGVNGSTFGVAGTNSYGSLTPYLTFYLPSVVAGIFAGSSAAILAQAAGGQL